MYICVYIYAYWFIYKKMYKLTCGRKNYIYNFTYIHVFLSVHKYKMYIYKFVWKYG